MTHSSEKMSETPRLLALPEFHPDDPPEMRVAVWQQIIRREADLPESVLDAALFKMLEEIRLSL